MSGALAELLAGAFGANGHAVATAEGHCERPENLLALAERVRRALLDRDIAANEPVHIRIGNRPADLGALLGIWRAGAVAVPIHVVAASSTIERVRRATSARYSIDGERIDTIASRTPPNRPLLGGAALVIFTSGSTGEPKGVVIGHQRFAGKLAVLDRLLRIDSTDAVLCPLQLTFIFGLWVALLTLMNGARLVLVPKFSRDAMERGLADATVVAGVPTMFRELVTFGTGSASRLRLILTGGEVLAPALAQAMQRFSPAAIHDLYGLTETGSCDFCLGPADQPRGFATIGRPTAGVTFRLVKNGSPVEVGETGELQIRSPFGMLGYLDNPELTGSSFDGDYFKTGDLARSSTDGCVALVGRAKDIISRGGNKIAPLEIDNLLTAHPDIVAALCAGVPDERLGEIIPAVIVPRQNARIDESALRDWLLERIERFKVPDVFHLCDTLPSGSTGKADRKAIARLAAERSKRR
jgi:long-chain acyl-CoA synthetase